MLTRGIVMAISFLFGAILFAQTPAPTSTPTVKSAAPKSSTSSAPSAASPTPGTQEIINSLGEADLQAALSLLKNNFANPDAITDTELNRATLTGLLMRMPGGFLVLPNRESAPTAIAAPFYSEVFEGHIAYLRLGSLNTANLKELDKTLSDFGAKKINAVILDLRASASGDFAIGSEFAKRFCPKGKLLFSLRKQGARQDRSFSSDRDPSFQGLTAILADADTAGAGEVVAAVIRLYDKALLIGQATAACAVEYSDQPLPSGKILRVASSEAVLADGQSLFPVGLKPDLPVELPIAVKREIFRLSGEKGMAVFVYETERPHLNEAALIAGTNPELESVESSRLGRAREKAQWHDSVLQRALDAVTSLEVYQKR
jgi:Peptidase family S41